MTCYFEIVVKLPNDFYSDLPGINDRWVESLCAEVLPDPDGSDLDLYLVETVYVCLAQRIKEEIVLEWSYRAGAPFRFFFQLEKGEHFFHLHCLIDRREIKGFVFGRFVPGFRERIRDRVYGGVEPAVADWFEVAKTKKNGGANALRDEGYIYTYLLPKKQPELQWAWTNITELEPAALNLQDRRRLIEEREAEFHSQEEVDQGQSGGTPRVYGKSADRYMALVRWLVSNGITSESEWIETDAESFLTHNANSNGRSQIKSALENASRIMQLTKTAVDYLIGQNPPEDVTTNRAYRIFEMNGYDPRLAGSILVGWARKQFGKRNTVWLYGPATTGKTIIARAIAHAVPFYGNVNWTNENFPFNDSVNKMIIWWEEGKMTAKIVEAAKAILGGSDVRVDQKCKSSQQIKSTPVIVTSNTDMTLVVDGNMTTMEHRQPLEDRMFQFYLHKRLPHDFGLISKQEMREFFKWAELNQVPVPHVFSVPTCSAAAAQKRPISPSPPFHGETARDADRKTRKKARYDRPKPEPAKDQNCLDKWLEDSPPPRPSVVHDLQDSGDTVFDFRVVREVECPDSNKEQ